LLTALIVEDDTLSARALSQLIRGEGFQTATASTLAEARNRLRLQPADIVLIDLMLPDGNGLDLLDDLERDWPRTFLVVVTGHATMETAIHALRRGAADYLTKPVDHARLTTVLTNLKRQRELRQEVSALRSELRELGHFGPMIGISPPMQKVFDMIGKVAPTQAPVLILGESGTGKELVAQTVHQLSRRKNEAFVAVNCGAISPNLIESELFGHEKGSFTGADKQHRGLFERASGGTLFLDEISEMPLELQVKLLRVLETQTILRVGGDRPIKIDVRILSASNRDLKQTVSEGKFRQDLLYRLNVFPIDLPALRERAGDIELLAQHFLEDINRVEGRHQQLAPAATAALRSYAWPGNVRELKNVIYRSTILADGEIGCDALPPDISGVPVSEGTSLRFTVGTPFAEVERRLLLASLEFFGGDRRKTAEALGISTKTLYNRLKEYGAADPES
jgi:two-component system, NtrC family, response regulator AtoC